MKETKGEVVVPGAHDGEVWGAVKLLEPRNSARFYHPPLITTHVANSSNLGLHNLREKNKALLSKTALFFFLQIATN